MAGKTGWRLFAMSVLKVIRYANTIRLNIANRINKIQAIISYQAFFSKPDCGSYQPTLGKSGRSLPSKTLGLMSGQKRITVSDMDTKIQFQRAGLGFGFLPKILIEKDLKEGTLVELIVEEVRQPEPVWLAMRTADKGEAAIWWFKKLNRQLLGDIRKV